MKTRTECDSLGQVQVPADKYYGSHTERAIENFVIGEERMPIEVIQALALVKKVAARVNRELGLLSADKERAIGVACDEVLGGEFDGHFPLVVWQTGSGTQTNMNVNEVIGNRAIELMGGKIGSKDPVHPNDDVNMSQSSNDAFPTAMHISALLLIRKRLLPNLKGLRDTLIAKSKQFETIVKIGRTHLMDATPMTLGQEFSGYAAQLDGAIGAVEATLGELSQIAQGGTAVGTGLNAPKGFAERFADVLTEYTGVRFVTAPNKFAALASHDAIVWTSSALRRVAVALMKMANDIRWMASGPRSGLSEISIPANELGSSIMPGKINPTQCEALTMVAVQVMGNDTAIGIAGSQGNFELNVFKSVIIYDFLQSIRLLADASLSFNERCVVGIEPVAENIERYLNRSLMLVTALSPEIGYDLACKIAQTAHAEGKTLREVALEMKALSPERFDALVDPKKMV